MQLAVSSGMRRRKEESSEEESEEREKDLEKMYEELLGYFKG